MITLQSVDRNNWVACTELSLDKNQQELVASNLETIAESKYEPHYHLRAIYKDKLLVGMLAYCHENDPEDHELFWIFRLMVDVSHQRQGIGLAAVKLAIEEMKALGAKRILTMRKPSNVIASTLYEKLGFEPTGSVLDDGDILLGLNIEQNNGA